MSIWLIYDFLYTHWFTEPIRTYYLILNFPNVFNCKHPSDNWQPRFLSRISQVLCLLYMAPIYTPQHAVNGNTRHLSTRFNKRDIVIQTSLTCLNTQCDVIHAAHMKAPTYKCGLYTTNTKEAAFRYYYSSSRSFINLRIS